MKQLKMLRPHGHLKVKHLPQGYTYQDYQGTDEEMQDWLLKLRNELGRTTLLVTHDIDEALYLADRIVVLGGHPAIIQRIIDLTGVEKSRDWLYEQSQLRKDIHNILKYG